MNDRFTRGLMAGLIAWIPTGIFNYLAFHFKFSTLVYSDFAAVFMYGRKSLNLSEALFSLVATAGFIATLGAIFAYLVKGITSKYLWLKGLLYGEALWFIIYAITVLFKVPQIEKIPFKTALSNSIGSLIWGLLLAYSLSWLNQRIENRS